MISITERTCRRHTRRRQPMQLCSCCIPLIEGAPCSLDVTTEKATITFNIQGDVEPRELDLVNPKLMKE